VTPNDANCGQEARTLLETCFLRIRLARATELARSRRFVEAQAELMRNGELPPTGQELDLLARIAALQGRFDEARRFWNVAIQIEPGNAIYRQYVESLTPARRVGRIIATAQDTLLNTLVWLAVAFGIGALVFAGWFK